MTDPLPKESANLLIVDDVPANLVLLSGMLRRRGYKVRPVPGGEHALQAARMDPPDLILLDITMPGMNGYEVCEHLKCDPNLKSIPVIFISALDEALDKVRAFTSGGVDYVTKPFQFEEVDARVRTHLNLRRQEKELESQYAKLKHIEQLRDNLVHMVVHDMRSPLFAIRMAVDILMEMELGGDGSVPNLLERINACTTQVNDMATQLLDISRLEAGEMPINKTEEDLVSSAQTTLESVRTTAGPRSLEFTPSEPCLTAFDKDLIHRVLANLLGNAFKFTPDTGLIKVAVLSQNNLARVEVTDNGHGIPPEYHQKIFEKFGQVEMRNKRIGTGLGLAFCRLAIEAHGGQIGVQSIVGQGSTFWFTLPLGAAPSAPAAMTAKQDSPV